MESGRQLAPSADHSGRGVKAGLRPMHVAVLSIKPKPGDKSFQLVVKMPIPSVSALEQVSNAMPEREMVCACLGSKRELWRKKSLKISKQHHQIKPNSE